MSRRRDKDDRRANLRNLGRSCTAFWKLTRFEPYCNLHITAALSDYCARSNLETAFRTLINRPELGKYPQRLKINQYSYEDESEQQGDMNYTISLVGPQMGDGED